jgi:hypothetical protein
LRCEFGYEVVLFRVAAGHITGWILSVLHADRESYQSSALVRLIYVLSAYWLTAVFLDLYVLRIIRSAFRQGYWDKDCTVCMGCNRSLVAVGNRPFIAQCKCNHCPAISCCDSPLNSGG